MYKKLLTGLFATIAIMSIGVLAYGTMLGGFPPKTMPEQAVVTLIVGVIAAGMATAIYNFRRPLN